MSENQETEYVEREAKLSEVGVYADRGVELTGNAIFSADRIEALESQLIGLKNNTLMPRVRNRRWQLLLSN